MNDSAGVLLDQPYRLLDPTFLVGADREAEVLGLNREAVLGEDDPAAGHRHTLDADQSLHERILAFSGSNGAVAPTTATVTGKRSFMYSTASASEPSTACSGGR